MTGHELFLQFLCNLGIPHMDSICDLKSKFGVSKSRFYEFLDVVVIKDSLPIVPQQVMPFEFSSLGDPDLLPPAEFSTLLGGSPDARDNHRRAVEDISRLFGKPPRNDSSSNTIGDTWLFGPSSLRIITWPPELNKRSVDPSHEKHPELRTFCSLSVANGYMQTLSEREAEWIRMTIPFVSNQIQALHFSDPIFQGSHKGIYRRLPANMQSQYAIVGRTPDLEAFIGLDEDTAIVVARGSITSFHLDRVLPARGSGGAHLDLEYVDTLSSIKKQRKIQIIRGAEPRSLDAMSESIAKLFGVDLIIREHLDD
jgi:hypothetical protein